MSAFDEINNISLETSKHKMYIRHYNAELQITVILSSALLNIVMLMNVYMAKSCT